MFAEKADCADKTVLSSSTASGPPSPLEKAYGAPVPKANQRPYKPKSKQIQVAIMEPKNLFFIGNKNYN